MSEVTANPSAPAAVASSSASIPHTAAFMFAIGFACFFASLFVGISLIPESSYRSDPTVFDYLPAMIWVVAGIIEGAVLVSIGQMLAYLDRIARATEASITARA